MHIFLLIYKGRPLTKVGWTMFENQVNRILMRAKWIKEGQRNSKYVYSLEKQNYLKISIQVLRGIISKFEDVLKEQELFCKQLYSKKETNTHGNLFFHVI